jgi:hypothetical protein
MPNDISELPKWAQTHIATIEADRALLKLKVDALARADELIQGDLLPPSESGVLSKGWDFGIHGLLSGYGGSSEIAFKACSSCVGHGNGGWERTTTQGVKVLFTTKKLALLAARSNFLGWFEGRLVLLEKMIQREEA